MTAAPPPVAAVPAEGAPAPAEPITQRQEGAFGNAFAKLDAMVGNEPAHEPKPAAAKETPAPAKQPEKPVAKTPEPKPEVKSAVKDDGKPAEAKSVPDFDANKAAPKQLREAYEKILAKHAELEKQHNELRTKSADDPERKKLSETLAEREKRLAEYEEKLHYLDYSESQEYKDKYYKPFVDAYQGAQARIAKLTMAPVENTETGEVVPGRKATPEDFDSLVRITDDDAAAEWAVKHFGAAKAQLVLMQREKVLELNAAKNKAIEDFRGKSKEIREAQQLARTNSEKHFDESWNSAGKVSREKWPQYYEPNPEDTKTEELLNTGFREAERAFFPNKPLQEGEQPMSQAELITAQRAMYNRAAAFPRITYDLQNAVKRVTELEAKLKAFEDSQPGKPDGKGGKAPEAKPRDALSAFDARFNK
jgi:hypothetical protein